jgi:DNA-binding transcriptional MerR regulator
MLTRESRVQPPALESFSDVPLFNTKAVVHQTGVPAPTLRAWERRYGILSPRRGENDYRQYSERDIAAVTWLRERVETGMTISQAIALMRSLEPARRRGRKSTASAGSMPQATPRAVGMPAHLGMQELTAALVDRFKSLDEQPARQIIAQALAIYTVEDVCMQLLTPALEEIGRLWATGEVGVTVEHFCTTLIRGQIANLYHLASGAQTGPLVLVGCAPGELHEIGPFMLALFLRRTGFRVAYLSQSVEPESLAQTMLAARPACVLLSATLPAFAERLAEVGTALGHARGARSQPPMFFGGQAFTADPDLARRLPGEPLLLNALEAAQELRKRLPA